MRMLGVGRLPWMLVGLVAALTVARCSGAGSAESMDNAGARAEEPAEEEAAAEELVESDIYKRDGDRLYVLNRYRGLLVTDLSNLDKPSITGRLPIPAQPREMWVEDGTALILTAQPNAWGRGWWGWWGATTDVDVNVYASYSGSALVLADITLPNSPKMTGILPLGGDCFDGRLRGSILYVVCSSNMGNGWQATDAHVYAVDVSNRSAPTIVGDVSLPRGATDHHIYVSASNVYVAATEYDRATIMLVDITSTTGELRQRGTVQVTGGIVDRFAMDEWQGHLRVGTGPLAGNGDAIMTTFDVTDPDAPRQVGRFVLRVDETLMSVRFDGPRGYMVTFRNVDPLFVFDLADPANPRMTGELEMTGWLDFMVPMGDRILAMGHEDVDEGSTTWGTRMTRRTLAVSLIDVTQGQPPRLLSRVPLDGRWGTIPAGREDFNKLFRVFKDQGLVLFPYRTFTDWGWTQEAGMLVIDWQNDTLAQAADLKDLGLVERGISWDDHTLVTLSVQRLNVVDITQRRAPVTRGVLELARNVSQLVLVNHGQAVVELAGDFGAGSATLHARGVDDVPGVSPRSSITLDAPTGLLFANGDLVYVVSIHKPFKPYAYYGSDEELPPEEPTTITVVDYADPSNPVVRSELSLSEELVFGRAYAWSGSAGRQVVQPVPGVIVIQRQATYSYSYGCSDSGLDKPAQLIVVDARRADNPHVSGRHELRNDNGYAYYGYGNGLMPVPNGVMLAGYGTHHLLDLSDVAASRLHAVVGPPLLATDAETGMVFGTETDNNGSRTDLITWTMEGTQLRQAARINQARVPGYFYGQAMAADGMLATDTGYSWGIALFRYTENTLEPLGEFSRWSDAMVLAGVGDGYFFTADGTATRVFRMEPGGPAIEVASVSSTGTGHTTLVHDGVLHVAAGYHGAVQQPLTSP